jgi:hypothetical protein
MCAICSIDARWAAAFQPSLFYAIAAGDTAYAFDQVSQALVPESVEFILLGRKLPPGSEGQRLFFGLFVW